MLDWFFALTEPEQWEVARNWLATIGGLIALLIAANTYRRNVKNKREEQARLIYSKITHVEYRNIGDEFPTLLNDARMGTGSPGLAHLNKKNPATDRWDLAVAVAPLIQVTVVIHNGSKELIGPARVQMVNSGLGTVWDTFSISTAEVEPESDYVAEFTWINEFHPGQPGLSTTLIFRDATRQWWRRLRSDPIERVHNDPENGSLPLRERHAARVMQEAMGIPKNQQVKEPRIGLVVRWHRLWRRLRGKSPIP
jgi:hypothetical protein